MNLVNRFFLSIVLLPKTMYDRMGVNSVHLEAILKTKLMMDDRRPNTLQQTRPNKTKNVTRATLGTMFLSALMGILFLMSFSVGNDYVTHLTVYFSMYIFLLASSLISDFTSVLIDIKDNFIILPKPVTDRTVVVSRMLHIAIHISKIVFPMSLAGLIYVAYNTHVVGTLVFFILILFAAVFTIFLINALYIFILKITTPEKFQGVISYFQIYFAMLMYSSYQLVPRLMDKTTLHSFDLSNNGWVWLAPPYWFAAAWHGISTFTLEGRYLLAIAVSIVIPIASVYVVIKYFAPAFNQKLLLINSGSSDQPAQANNSIKKGSTTSVYAKSMANLLSRKGAERMSFLFCWKMTGRSKDFKLKVYPNIGYLLVMLLIPFLKDRNDSDELIVKNGMGQFLFIGVIYLSTYLLMTAMQQIIYSDKYKAAWIYFISPVQSPGELIRGALKAAMVKFYLPIVVLVSIAAIIVAGPALLPNLVLAFLNEIVICSLITYLTVKELPFSKQQNNNSKGGTFIKGLFMMIIPIIAALFHFLIHKITPVVYICIALSAIAAWLVQGSLKNISWNKILSKLEE